MISKGMVVATFTICDRATAAAIELPSTFCRVRYRELTATCPTVGGMATPTYAVDSWTKKPRMTDSRFGTKAARLAAAAK